jgi:hypothetical protein
MVLVGKIRGYGGNELDDHKVVKMLEACSPRNETIVTLIRDKKKFEHFTPNDMLGRLLTSTCKGKRQMRGEVLVSYKPS